MTRSRILLVFAVLISSVAAHGDLQLTGMTPTRGPSSGGTSVVITGSGFFGGCAVPCAEVQVTFDGVTAASVRVDSDSRITAVSPAWKWGSGLAVYQDQFAYPPARVAIRVGVQEVAAWSFWYSDLAPIPDLSKMERVLLPSYNCSLKGAQGSLWCAEIAAFNASDEASVAYPVYPDAHYGSTISAFSIPARRYTHLELLITGAFTEIAPRSARVLYIDSGHADALRLNLRIFDRSRTTTTWGTEVPVVRERDLRSDAVELFPVPLDPLFRQSLRIYDPFRTGNAQVEVRFFVTRTGERVATRTATLPVYERTLPYGGVDQSFPGLAELNNLMIDVPELAVVPSTEQLRIEVVPVTPGLRFWAMVSLTNNDTQHVTLLTPQ
jgi:IPT/TIG domain